MKFDDEEPYRVPRDQSRWRSLALAAAIHAGLFFFLWIGVHWQSSEPVAVEAEVWDMKTQAAAPPPPPAAAPEPTPVPAPPLVAAPPPPPPDVVNTPAAPKPPDIALERRLAKLKAEKQAEQQAQEEQRKQQERDKAQLKAKLAQKKEEEAKAAEKAEAEAKAKASRDAQAKARAEAEQDKLDKLNDKKLADKKLADKKLEDSKLAKAKKDAENRQDQLAQDKARAAEMRRITGAAGSGSTGTAAKSTSPGRDSGYAAAVTSKIKSNIAYGGSTDVAGNPRAVYQIEQLPTGEIISIKKLKSSGIAAYDSAVENAIAKSSPLPKKKDGTVDREVNAGFNMKDLP